MAGRRGVCRHPSPLGQGDRSVPAAACGHLAPTTKAGRVAWARTSAASARTAGGGRVAACTGRRAAGAASASQSSTGTETKVGQKGGVRATAKAWAMAAGTSAARAGSDIYLT